MIVTSGCSIGAQTATRLLIPERVDDDEKTSTNGTANGNHDLYTIAHSTSYFCRWVRVWSGCASW